MDPFSPCWDALEDPRTGNAQRHDFHDLLMIALCTVLCGGRTATDMALFARAKETCLRGFLKLPAGLPSHATFSRLFRLLDPVKFSAWFQRFTAAIAAQIVEQGGDYALPTRLAGRCQPVPGRSGNQTQRARPRRRCRSRPDRDPRRHRPERYRLARQDPEMARAARHRQGGAGTRDRRQDQHRDRTLRAAHRVGGGAVQPGGPLPLAGGKPPALVSRLANTVIMRRDTGSLFSVACLSLKCEGISGAGHRRLDVAMNADQARNRAGHGAHHLAVPRHLAISAMQKEGTKGSLRGKFKHAAWNESYLNSLLALL